MLAYTVSYYSVKENRSTTWIKVACWTEEGQLTQLDEFVGTEPAWLASGELAYLKAGKLYVKNFTKNGVLDGTMRNNVSYAEHRNIASYVPKWNPDNCIQCGFCSFVCPHATIRQFALTEEEIAKGEAWTATEISSIFKAAKSLVSSGIIGSDDMIKAIGDFDEATILNISLTF